MTDVSRGKALAVIAAFTVLLASTPATAQGGAAPDVPLGWQFSEISGNRIAWACRGMGTPTVVLMAGWGLTAHATFDRIYRNYDGPGRLCLDDRAGMGDSKLVDPRTRTLDQLVEELKELSHQNNWGNAVLVPHSFGGFIARAYAQKYPSQTLGILFLDAAQEDYLPRLKAEMSRKDWAIMESLLAWNVKTFHEDYVGAQEAIRGTKLKPDLPITVLSRGVAFTNVRAAGISYEGMDVYEREHRALQSRIAALSNNSQHRVAHYATHLFNDTDPWIVIDEIKGLIKRLS